MTVVAGPSNSLLDVEGLQVGSAARRGEGWLTGTTVVLAGADGAVAGVDVRGGGPGTRETDLLDPRNTVERVHAVVLSGGSAFGLATADGVTGRLADAGIGVRVRTPAAEAVVPIVPAAVVFDLGRGGDVGLRPDAGLGAAAYDAAGTAVEQGVAGAGTGAAAGHLKGGSGTASARVGTATVAALVVVNCVGSPVDPGTGRLYGAAFGLPGEFPALGTATAGELEAFAAGVQALRDLMALHTTIGVVATDATLTKAQCAKMAAIGHDGMARAIRPVHTVLDGDTLFGLSTTRRPAPDLLGFHDLLGAAADCVTRAITHAVLAATTVTTPAGTWRSYRDAFASLFTDEGTP